VRTAAYRTVFCQSSTHSTTHRGEPCRFKVCRAPRDWGYHRVVVRSTAHRRRSAISVLAVAVVEVVEHTGEVRLSNLTVEAREDVHLASRHANVTSGSEDVACTLLTRIAESESEIVESVHEASGEGAERVGVGLGLESHVSVFLSE